MIVLKILSLPLFVVFYNANILLNPLRFLVKAGVSADQALLNLQEKWTGWLDPH